MTIGISGKNLKSGGTKKSSNANNPTREVTLASGKVLKAGSKEAMNYGQGSNAPTFGQPIDTSQPSPETAQIQPPNQGLVPYEQALKGLQTSGQPQGDIARATTALQNKYQQALPQLQAGDQAPQD